MAEVTTAEGIAELAFETPAEEVWPELLFQE